tara:strand:+ start:952 stop:1122 length:171 start_codon:yes stop_codon:yes gene_type:complete
MTEISITEEDWKAYRNVQKSGAFNMWDPKAIRMSGLPEDKYLHIISNYGDLAEKFE